MVSMGIAQPKQRMELIMADADAKIVLTMGHYVHLFGDVPIKSVVVDEHLLAALPSVPGPVQSSVTPSDAAFLIHTSGSTGTPKVSPSNRLIHQLD